jgi:hypothetical protein
MEDRRARGHFTETLSIIMVVIAALGAFLVLADPKITLTFYGQSFVIDGTDFSADLKGAVVSLILIGGWTAVKEYWLGSSAGSEKKSDTISRLASNPVDGVKVVNTMKGQE